MKQTGIFEEEDAPEIKEAMDTMETIFIILVFTLIVLAPFIA